MRKNLFLHFLNRDSREIFALYRFHSDPQHLALLKQALNAAILICEDHCVIPPGFTIEDELAFELSEVNAQFLSERLIHLPMRETSLPEYAEKKRIEYSPQRDRYSGLFSDRRLEFLGTNAVGLVHRRSRIGEEIVRGWEAAADGRSKLWSPVKKVLSARTIEVIRHVPSQIASEGRAVTWAEIEKRLPRETGPAHGPLRDSLQHIYFRQYCQEFALNVLCELPFMSDEFGLPTDRAIYSFHRLTAFLQVFRLGKLLLRCSAATICEIKRRPGLTRFLDAYQGITKLSKSVADLRLIAHRAYNACRFDWEAFEGRHALLLAEPDGLAITEMNDALSEAAALLTSQNGLPIRSPDKSAVTRSAPSSRKIEVHTMPELVMYVALNEELDVLAKHFNLEKHPTNPIARGQMGKVAVHVLSASSMGRVPAAVEVARYLEARKGNKPRLILIAGLAGGFEEEGTQPGHILCGTTAVDLASRKIQDKDEATATRFRRKDFPLDPALGRVLNSSMFEMDGWRNAAIEQADWPDDRRPSLRYGLIASVDEVVASSDWRRKLLDNTEKLLGVEMEAGGVCAAAEVFKVPVSMLRAVADGADPSKADTAWRKRGMKTIATLLERLPFIEVFKAMDAV